MAVLGCGSVELQQCSFMAVLGYNSVGLQQCWVTAVLGYSSVSVLLAEWQEQLLTAVLKQYETCAVANIGPHLQLLTDMLNSQSHLTRYQTVSVVM